MHQRPLQHQATDGRTIDGHRSVRVWFEESVVQKLSSNGGSQTKQKKLLKKKKFKRFKESCGTRIVCMLAREQQTVTQSGTRKGAPNPSPSNGMSGSQRLCCSNVEAVGNGQMQLEQVFTQRDANDDRTLPLFSKSTTSAIRCPFAKRCGFPWKKQKVRSQSL